MDYTHKPRRILITGKSGTGKSEYFIRYINSVAPRYSQVCIFDFECEFASRAGWTNIRTPQELEQRCHIQAYDYCEMYPGDLPTSFEFYCDYTFSLAKQREDSGEQFLFCSDELQKIDLGTGSIPRDLSCLVETGRRYKVDCLFIAQQCNTVHNRIRNQVTEVVTFRHNDSRAIEWLVEYGFDEDSIRSLGIGDFICRTDAGIERRGNIFGRVRAKSPDQVGGGQTDDSGVDTQPHPALHSESDIEPGVNPVSNETE